ncbi:MAG: hypothetical protein JSU09_17180 [Bacteroidetes bacterium]|nr:hypothetical protein [Bacteroidota bacterium]
MRPAHRSLGKDGAPLACCPPRTRARVGLSAASPAGHIPAHFGLSAAIPCPTTRPQEQSEGGSLCEEGLAHLLRLKQSRATTCSGGTTHPPLIQHHQDEHIVFLLRLIGKRKSFNKEVATDSQNYSDWVDSHLTLSIG